MLQPNNETKTKVAPRLARLVVWIPKSGPNRAISSLCQQLNKTIYDHYLMAAIITRNKLISYRNASSQCLIAMPHRNELIVCADSTQTVCQLRAQKIAWQIGVRQKFLALASKILITVTYWHPESANSWKLTASLLVSITCTHTHTRTHYLI